MTDFLVCFVTVDDPEKALHIARIVVEKRLAACVNIVPEIRSIYFWKDKICDEAERLLIVKTRRDLYPSLESAIREAHPYEVPEIIALKIEEGLPDYLKWLRESTPAGD
jgi:periplasmic divalent cation tolerance protein